MSDSIAIRLDNVSKIYRLYSSQHDQLIDVLGLPRFGIRPRKPVREFAALDRISVDVEKGQRVGILGRNGAGKTTLLKLICGNFSPTSGTVEVNGMVQALLGLGLGFHPEYTGRENIHASLQYNGLTAGQHDESVADIIDFCELGEFIDQPFKTYSLGMQARLMFAAATAIRPDILIVDEVLGAGDAYFVAKSRMRVERMVSSGCTMLLVSHSMSQILEICKEAIWLDGGRIRMRGEAFLVVKAYEEYVHGPIARIQVPEIPAGAAEDATAEGAPTDTPPQSGAADAQARFDLPGIAIQEPQFLPHQYPRLAGDPHMVDSFDFVAPGGLSRWNSERGLKFIGFSIFSDSGKTADLVCMRNACLVMKLTAEDTREFECRFGIAVYDHLGHCVLDVLSPLDKFSAKAGDVRHVTVAFNPLQLGPGQYTISISAHDYGPIAAFNSTVRYDLLNRSFLMNVELPDSLRPIVSMFYHSAEWTFAR